jgi:putative ABC transport system permease protein
MNISDAQRITENTGNVSRLDVYADDASYVEEIADVIKTYSGLSVTTYSDRMARYQTISQNAQSTLSQTQTTATEEIIIAVAATSLIILFTMLYNVRERTKEIGVLKAIGFSSWNVMSQFMLEGILISLAAGAVGIAIGSIGAPFLSSFLLPHLNLFGGESGRFRPTFGFADIGTAGSQVATATLDLQLVLLAFGVAVLLGAFGSLYPAWRAARTRPAEAMRYE